MVSRPKAFNSRAEGLQSSSTAWLCGVAKSVAIAIFLLHGASNADCRFPSASSVLEADEHHAVLNWTFEEDEALYIPVRLKQAPLTAYHRSVAASHPTDPVALIQRKADILRLLQRPTINLEQIVSGQVGSIRRIDCLDAVLFRMHDRHFPVRQAPTEFSAFVLRDEDAGMVKIYLSTSDSRHVGTVFPVVYEELENDLLSGWQLWYHLHNHPFEFKQVFDLGGSIAPSDAADFGDLHYYQVKLALYNPREVRITNGISTLVISWAELSQLHFVDRKSGTMNASPSLAGR